MKILHVCLCGAVFNEKYAYQDNLLTKYHKKLGHDVTIIAPTYSEYGGDDGGIISAPAGVSVINDGIQLIRLKPALPVRLNQSFHIFWGLERAVNGINPNIIFVHGVTSLNYRIWNRYKRKHPEVKMAYDNHADYENSCHNIITLFYSKYIIREFVVKKLLATSDFFYGVTPARCDFLKEMYGVPPAKIHLLPMGADDEEMLIEQRHNIRKDVRKQYGVKDDEFLIVTGGKIDPLKNIHVLAQAVSQSSFSKIKILIFGSVREDLKDTFDKLKSDRVILIGWQPSNQVYRFFYAADLVMFPGLHSVLWEQAVASQVPCAFSRIKGFEHVDIGGNCVLMEEKTSNYYLSLIENIYTNKDFYKGLQANADSSRAHQFLYSNIAKRVINDLK